MPAPTWPRARPCDPSATVVSSLPRSSRHHREFGALLAGQAAADQIVKIFRHPTFEGIVNCASGSPISVRRLVETRLEERGATMELGLGKFTYPKYEPFGFWADNARLQQIMQGSPQ